MDFYFLIFSLFFPRVVLLVYLFVFPALILTGFMLGLIEGLTKVFYPEASNTVIFVVMAIVLMIKPAGLFGSQR